MRTSVAHSSNGQSKPVVLNGWKRQPKDSRDQQYALKFHGSFLARPASVDLRPYCSPVEDQADLGSCTANAAAGLVEANEVRAGLKASAAAAASVAISSVSTSAAGVVSFKTTVTPAVTPTPTPTPPAPTPKFVNVSRLFQYYATRLVEGTVSYDSGAYIRDAIKAMATYGIVDETLWPYDTTKFAVNPPTSVWSAAATHKISSYHAITDGDLETMKVAISQGYLIEFGFDVYSAFLTVAMSNSGMLIRPKANEALEGGHAVALCGYDDNKVMPDGSTGAFLVRNSWGTSWGLGGYFYMSYGYVADTKLCSDFWVIVSQPL